jgi:hypothetical protein
VAVTSSSNVAPFKAFVSGRHPSSSFFSPSAMACSPPARSVSSASGTEGSGPKRGPEDDDRPLMPVSPMNKGASQLPDRGPDAPDHGGALSPSYFPVAHGEECQLRGIPVNTGPRGIRVSDARRKPFLTRSRDEDSERERAEARVAHLLCLKPQRRAGYKRFSEEELPLRACRCDRA